MSAFSRSVLLSWFDMCFPQRVSILVEGSKSVLKNKEEHPTKVLSIFRQAMLGLIYLNRKL